jgi:muramidase (phage lysozyme)
MADTIDSDISFLSGFKPKEVPLTDEDIKHPNVQAYLNYLNAYEGKPAPNQTVGYKEFKDLSDHPRQKVVFNDKGDVSDAAGAYQLLGSTWDTQKKKHGLKDFSLPNQQKAAVGILKDIGALPYIQSGEFDKANELARGQWASLPGSTIGLKTGQIPKLNPEAEKILAQAKAEYDPDISFLSGFKPREKAEKAVQTLKDISAFSNKQPTELEPNAPAIKQLGRRLVEDIQKPLGEMSWEDFKKKSLLAPAATYTAATLGVPGFTEKEKQEAQANLEQKGGNLVKALKNVANMPVQEFTQGVINTGKQLVEHPGTAIGEQVKSTIYDPEQLLAPQAISAVGKPLMAGGKKVAGAITEAAMKEPFIAERVGNINATTSQAKNQMAEAFANVKQRFNEPEAGVTVTGAPNVGAAQTTNQTAVNALLPNLNPQTQAFIKSQPIEKINLPALETKALEDDLGIKLSKSQRTNNGSGYANEWNARDTNKNIQKLFSEQPQQFADAFEKIKDRHASDIGELTKENIGQLEINALAAKDKMRTDAINAAKKALVDENGGQFPVDIGALKQNINNSLNSNYKSRYLSDALKGDLEDFYKNPTFEAYEHIRSNLADEMRSAKDGKSRQAAFIARDELEKLPIFGEEGGSPQAIKLKSLADTYRRLNVERYNVIKTNPAYKAAIKEAIDAEDAGAMESLNAANFHDKFVTGKTATPEVVRRMVLELQDNPEAMKAIRAGDILNAENALVPNKMTPQLKPDAYNKYLRSQADKAKYIHSPESAQDLLNIGILSSKVAKPAENVFNYSNSYSAYLGDLVKQGLQLKGEGALAAMTKGASIPVVAGGKELFKLYSDRKFGNEVTHPHSGLINKE